MKRILLFSRDPGGANTVIPLYKKLKKKYDVVIFGKDSALQKYAQNKISGKNIVEFVKEISLEEIKILLEEISPDIVITGTSADDQTEKFIWKACEEMHIPSYAILDQWINYLVRFSRYQTNSMQLLNAKDKLEYLPKKILLMDEKAKEEAIKSGLPEERLIVTGQPYFETIVKNANTIKKTQIKSFRDKLKINDDDLLITFASEPLLETYKKPFFGYSEVAILQSLLDSVVSVEKKMGRKIHVLLRAHPKDDISKYKDIICKNLTIKQFKCASQIVVLSSDLICGMSSMFLIESVVLGRPVMSIQIGLNKEDPFILSRIKLLKTMLSYQELEDSLLKVLSKKSGEKIEFKVIKNPSDKIANLIKKELCQY